MNTTACYEAYLCHCGEDYTDNPTHTCYFTEQEDYNDDDRLEEDYR